MLITRRAQSVLNQYITKILSYQSYSWGWLDVAAVVLASLCHIICLNVLRSFHVDWVCLLSSRGVFQYKEINHSNLLVSACTKLSHELLDKSIRKSYYIECTSWLEYVPIFSLVNNGPCTHSSQIFKLRNSCLPILIYKGNSYFPTNGGWIQSVMEIFALPL